jgi:hypothetical protein
LGSTQFAQLEMTLSRLEELIAHGFEAVSGDDLGDLAAECQRNCEDTGDARYCIIANLFERIRSWWSEHSEYGGVPFKLQRDIGNTLQLHLPAILSSASPTEAALLATMLKSEIVPMLLDSGEWEEP